jgi:ribosomal protein S30
LSASCGESGRERNRKLAVSCVSAAPVCDKVILRDLDPDIETKVKANLANKIREEEEYQKRTVQPEQQTNQTTDGNKLVAEASITIIGACTAWKTGVIQRTQIMNTAKELFSKQGYDPSSVDWDRAIKVAVELDKQKNLGCLK